MQIGKSLRITILQEIALHLNYGHSAGITFSFIIYFGTINITLGVFVGIFAFIGSLVISRLLDVQMVKAT
jgi:hypothetical protein